MTHGPEPGIVRPQADEPGFPLALAVGVSSLGILVNKFSATVSREAWVGS